MVTYRCYQDMTLVEDEFMSVIVPECEDTCMEDEAFDSVAEIAEMLDDATASSNCTQVTSEVPAKVSFLTYLIYLYLSNDNFSGIQAPNDIYLRAGLR